MKKKQGVITVIVIIVVLGLGGIYARSVAMNTSTDPKNEIIFSIPIGDKGIHYSGNNPNALIWGPAAIVIAPDDSFWIADTPANRLVHLDSKGSLLDQVGLKDSIVGIGDIDVTSKELWALDMASIPPKIVQLSLNGKVLEFYDLPQGMYLEDGLSGIAIGNDGSILIELGGGENIIQFISSSGTVEKKKLEGYPFQDKVYSTFPASLPSDDPSHRYILAGEKRIGVEFATELGGLNILSISTDGGFWVVVEEMIMNPAIQVDQKVYRYNGAGNLIGMARVPLAEMYVPISHGITVSSSGEVYILLTKPDGAEIHKLVFSAKLSAILPSISNTGEAK